MPTQRSARRSQSSQGCRCVHLDGESCVACERFRLQCVPIKGPIRSTTIQVRAAVRTWRLRCDTSRGGLLSDRFSWFACDTISSVILPAVQELAELHEEHRTSGGDDDIGPEVGEESSMEFQPEFLASPSVVFQDIFPECTPHDVERPPPGLKILAEALGLTLTGATARCHLNPLSDICRSGLRHQEHTMIRSAETGWLYRSIVMRCQWL
ncbi:uncharacterized protein EI90DRAFT_3043972 [Cantharellus anzutake]|uniref:uncharacterized protein n=1 Tax=Cantharellus anzutake TaxID=1750568 RepID=UPI0019045DA0|nr:uncharacterized protein EI90DRAFT_3043972 [Cantharellus anzutake]KAF8336883.1 hypothetical protein EI90DRAFT_3043972 [Cantharellus anzutake]